MLEIIRQWQQRYFGAEALALIILLLGVAVAIAMLGSVLAPVFASLILAYLMHGWVVRLSHLKVPCVVSAVILSLMLVCFMVFVLFVMLPLIWEQMGRLYAELPSMLSQLRELLKVSSQKYNIDLDAAQAQVWTETFNNQLVQWGRHLVSQSLGTIIGLAQLAVYLVLVPLLVFFLLRDGTKITAALRERMEPGGMFLNIWNEMDLQLANYVRGKTVEILLVGLSAYGLFLFFGLRYTVLLAVLSGLSVLIPYVGAFAVSAIVALVSLIQWGVTDPFYYVVTLYLVLQIFDGNILVPIIFSDTVSLHPVSIVLAVLVFGGLWGVWGVFFAIPLATLVKAIYTAWPQNTPSKAS